MSPVRPGTLIRVARADEVPVVLQLDALVFPGGHPDLQPAAEGELEAGVAARDVHLLECDGRAVAYVYADRTDPSQIYVSGLAVHPEFQGRGLGTMMIDRLLHDIRAASAGTPAVVTVTSPRNTTMLRVLLARGFAGRWLLLDHFGPGRHRVGAQLRDESAPGYHGPHALVPIGDVRSLHRLVHGEGHVLRAVERAGSGPAFRVTPPVPGEFPVSAPPPGATHS